MARPSIYSRPAKPMFVPVQSRTDFAEIKPGSIPEPLAVDAATECHVTPDDVAARMVEYLGPQGDYLTFDRAREPGNWCGRFMRPVIAGLK